MERDGSPDESCSPGGGRCDAPGSGGDAISPCGPTPASPPSTAVSRGPPRDQVWVGAGLPDLAGAILLLEDLRHVGLGQIDRHLTHLIRSGALDGVAAVALGPFEGFRGYTDGGWTVADVLRDRLGDLGVPVLGGLELGHQVVGPDGTPDQFAATLGAIADLDTYGGTLTVGPCVR